jgi:hypothetical protein
MEAFVLFKKYLKDVYFKCIRYENISSSKKTFINERLAKTQGLHISSAVAKLNLSH